MKFDAAVATDIGRVREGNEDAFLMESPLFAVADGMGGHLGGEVASQLALETLDVLFRHKRGTLADGVREANRAVFERSTRDAEVAGMGTTLTAAIAAGGQLRLAHVGDSRAYLLRDGELAMLTEDHTLVNKMVQTGEITRDEADVHPQRSVITRALGTEPDVQVDEAVIDLHGGDRVLLCTDGLTGMVTEDRIREILTETTGPRDAVDGLVRTALAEGGVDNVTVLLIDVLDDEPAAATGQGRGADGVGTETIVASGLDAGRPSGRTSASSRRAVPWRRIVLWGTGIVLVLAIAVVGVRAYVDTQWYVGVSSGRVAIYQGVPSRVLGFELDHVIVETSISATAAQQLPPFGQLTDGIPVEDRAGADEVVRQIEADLRAAELERQRQQEQEQRQQQKKQGNAG